MLQFNNSGTTDVYSFLKVTPETAVGFRTFTIKTYKNKTLIDENTFIDYSDNDRYTKFKVTTIYPVSGASIQDNFELKEGWYDFIINEVVSEVSTLVDEGQIFIGDYKESATEKVFYEK